MCGGLSTVVCFFSADHHICPCQSLARWNSQHRKHLFHGCQHPVVKNVHSCTPSGSESSGRAWRVQRTSPWRNPFLVDIILFHLFIKQFRLGAGCINRCHNWTCHYCMHYFAFCHMKLHLPFLSHGINLLRSVCNMPLSLSSISFPNTVV